MSLLISTNHKSCVFLPWKIYLAFCNYIWMLPWPKMFFLPCLLMCLSGLQKTKEINMHCTVFMCYCIPHTVNHQWTSLIFSDYQRERSWYIGIPLLWKRARCNLLLFLLFSGPHVFGKKGEVWVPEEQAFSHQTEDSGVHHGHRMKWSQPNTKV